MIRMSFLLALALAIPSPTAQGEVSVQDSPTAIIEVGGVKIRITISKARRTVVLSAKGVKEDAEIPFPGQVGEVREVSACTWIDGGVALAIKAYDSKASLRTYHWATVRFNPDQREFGVPVTDEFLRTADDLDVASIRNSTGDSIYIALLRHDRTSRTKVTGYTYVHNCPVAPIKGQLYKLRAELLQDPAIAPDRQ